MGSGIKSTNYGSSLAPKEFPPANQQSRDLESNLLTILITNKLMTTLITNFDGSILTTFQAYFLRSCGYGIFFVGHGECRNFPVSFDEDIGTRVEKNMY